MDLTVENRGRRDENVLVKLAQVPEGWQAEIKSDQFAVTGVPRKSLRQGTYTFRLSAATADNAFTVTQPVVVTLEERKAGPTGDLQVTTSYPVLRGPTDSSFEFSLEVDNKADVDRIVNVAAETPKWAITPSASPPTARRRRRASSCASPRPHPRRGAGSVSG
jgi:hypothetical protein